MYKTDGVVLTETRVRFGSLRPASPKPKGPRSRRLFVAMLPRFVSALMHRYYRALIAFVTFERIDADARLYRYTCAIASRLYRCKRVHTFLCRIWAIAHYVSRRIFSVNRVSDLVVDSAKHRSC